MFNRLSTAVLAATSALAALSDSAARFMSRARAPVFDTIRGSIPRRIAKKTIPRHKRRDVRPKPGKPGRRPKYRPSQRSGRRRGQ